MQRILALGLACTLLGCGGDVYMEASAAVTRDSCLTAELCSVQPDLARRRYVLDRFASYSAQLRDHMSRACNFVLYEFDEDRPLVNDIEVVADQCELAFDVLRSTLGAEPVRYSVDRPWACSTPIPECVPGPAFEECVQPRVRLEPGEERRFERLSTVLVELDEAQQNLKLATAAQAELATAPPSQISETCTDSLLGYLRQVNDEYIAGFALCSELTGVVQGTPRNEP